MIVNGRYLTRKPAGVDRFAIELVAALGRLEGPKSQRIAVPPGTMVLDPQVAVDHEVFTAGTHGGQRWEQFDLPRAAGDEPLVNLCNTGPMARRRQLTVIHDLGTVANAANYSRAFRAWYRVMHGVMMKRAEVIASVSRFSADELTRHHGRRRNGIEVVYEGGEHILRHEPDGAIIDKLGLRDRPFVLAVGSQSINKNFDAVLKAVQLLGRPGLTVVAAGGGNARIFNQRAGTALSDAAFKVTGYVSDGELRALYEHAAAFAFPSFYEGFGLPPLEAMCCGCPVVVSDRASLPEVCGDGALYCKAEDPATLASALGRLLDSRRLRQEMIDKGRARAATFGWDKAALQFKAIMDANFR